jgi:hypothetical protein
VPSPLPRNTETIAAEVSVSLLTTTRSGLPSPLTSTEVSVAGIPGVVSEVGVDSSAVASLLAIPTVTEVDDPNRP